VEGCLCLGIGGGLYTAFASPSPDLNRNVRLFRGSHTLFRDDAETSSSVEMGCTQCSYPPGGVEYRPMSEEMVEDQPLAASSSRRGLASSSPISLAV